MVLNAKQARVKSKEVVPKTFKTQKQLGCRGKYDIPLPYKMPIVEMLINRAIDIGECSCKVHNEITDEVEQTLLDNGYKVTWYKNFIKISW